MQINTNSMENTSGWMTPAELVDWVKASLNINKSNGEMTNDDIRRAIRSKSDSYNATCPREAETKQEASLQISWRFKYLRPDFKSVGGQ